MISLVGVHLTGHCNSHKGDLGILSESVITVVKSIRETVPIEECSYKRSFSFTKVTFSTPAFRKDFLCITAPKFQSGALVFTRSMHGNAYQL